jgi:hypothetical protein
VIDLGITALATLIPISILSGILMLLVFRHTTDQNAVRRARNLVTAYLLEFRLFMDEPRLVLRAQRKLLLANLQWLKLVLVPVVVLTVPMALLLAQMDTFYGHAPLRVGKAVVVTTQLEHAGVTPVLNAPASIEVETPPVQVPAENQVSWRLRPLRAASAALTFTVGDRTLTKSIVAGHGLHRVSERRAGSLAAFLLYSAELPFFDADVAWIEISYPAARILRLHWMIWFFVVSGLTALALKRRFRVSF